MKLDSLGLLDAVTRQALIGLPFGATERTSSVTANFLRNSADHPLYPKHGSRFSITSDFAGGAFGGAVNYHKHRIEERLYLPSAFKFLTTMVRVRVGVLASYAGQHAPVPVYERFRLGGGTTPDPLRGYDDYMVVPTKFIRDIETQHDYDPNAAPDSTRTSRVRYPGGRYMLLTTIEQQFPIVHPLHGVLFFDAGNVWDGRRDIHPFDLKVGAGFGFRMEIPLLGIIGFDYGYGFNRDDRPRAVGHFIIGQTSF